MALEQQFTEQGRDMTPFAVFAGMGRNVQAIVSEFTKMSQENMESGAKAAEKLREVKNLPEVFAVQSDLVKATFETIGAHYPRIAEIAASTPVEIIKGYQEALGKIADVGGEAARKAADTTRSAIEQTTSAARQATDKTAATARSTMR